MAMKFKLERKRIDHIPDEKVICEFERVAKLFNGRRFTRNEFNKLATVCKGVRVCRAFGSWANALKHVGIQYTRYSKSRNKITDAQLFEELERIWHQLGHRPSRIEWEASHPKYSYGSYKRRFNGWGNACALFIEYKSNPVSSEPTLEATDATANVAIPAENKRNIPLKLRLTVLQRDNFRCVLCGKSPATDLGVQLHIDHIVPFSRKGETIIQNLRTLCKSCNLGKGADESLAT
jgi:hypothetical protein